MDSHGSLCDSKSPQVSRTLLSILADLSNAVVRMASTCPLISESSSIFPSAPTTVVINVTCSIASSALKQGPDIHTTPFNFTLRSAKLTIRQVLFIFFSFFFFSLLSLGLVVWPSGRDLVIRLYLKISEKFVRLILCDEFQIVHILLVRMVKF